MNFGELWWTEAPSKVVTARPPKRLAQLRNVSHALVSTLQTHRPKTSKLIRFGSLRFRDNWGWPMTMYGGSCVVYFLNNNNDNFIFGHAFKLLNTYTVRPWGAKKQFDHPVRHHPSDTTFKQKVYNNKTIFLLPWHYTILFLPKTIWPSSLHKWQNKKYWLGKLSCR